MRGAAGDLLRVLGGRRVASSLLVAALALAVGTFAILAGYTPVKPTTAVVVALFAANGALILALFTLVAAEALRLASARRAGVAGARMHVRIVALFSFVAAVPAILMSIFAVLTVVQGLNPSFMGAVGGFVDATTQAANRYQDEQCRSLVREGELTADDLGKALTTFGVGSDGFRQIFDSRAKFLSFKLALIVNSAGERVDGADGASMAAPTPRPADFADARAAKPQCLVLGDRVTYAVLRAIPGYPEFFLYAGRRID
ncbi:MAG: PAS domain-containing sensor histidine kinase, partial [Hyphomicrobiales bacterium]|nr:PAS domain-containing sensor histidine kinase [Hyphomicrobiales bacterium]